jgi:hypothetical protein
MVKWESLVCTYMFVWCRGMGVDVLFPRNSPLWGCVLVHCFAWRVYNIVPAECKVFFSGRERDSY